MDDMFKEETSDEFLFPDTPSNLYATTPQVSPTLLFTMADSPESASVLSQRMATDGPAAVAAERAKYDRNEYIQLLKGTAQQAASEGQADIVNGAVEQIKNIQAVEANVENKPTFHDDVSVVAEARMEEIMATTGKSRDEIIRMATVYKDGIATRTAMEVAIGGLSQRGTWAQMGMDVAGLTTVEDWARLSPIVNEQLEQLGFKGPRALTFATSTSNFTEMLRQIPEADRGKVVQSFTNKLVDVVGDKSARRFLEAAMTNLVPDPTTEAVFGALDMSIVTSFIKGGMRALNIATDIVKMSRKAGLETQVAQDIANKLTEGKSMLGVSTNAANDAAISAQILDPLKDVGLAPQIQKVLRDRLEASIANINAALNTGGANVDELMATKKRLEMMYSNASNPSIITSNVLADTGRGTLGIDVIYGNASGKAFATAEEALDYYKGWKLGTLEVIPAGSKTDDLIALEKEADAKLTQSLVDLEATRFKPQKSTLGDLSQLATTPLFNYNKQVRTVGTKAIETAGETDKVAIRDVWNSLRESATDLERLVVDKVVSSLPQQTKVIIKAGKGRSYYSPAHDIVVMYRGAKDTNVFTHELIHSATSSKIKYGLLNPSSNIGKIVKNMDTLRHAVIKTLPKIQDKELKGYLTYLTKNLEEFSTSGMWTIDNIPKVAEHLNNIKYQNTTLLSHIWEAFKDLLGFGKNDTALSEWFGLSEQLTRQGLKVTLPESIMNKTGDVLTVADRARLYPAKPLTKEVDSLLKDVEDSVTTKAAIADHESTAAEGFYVRQKADMPVFMQDIGKISEEELSRMHLLLGKLNPRLASVNSIYRPALASMYKRTALNRVYADFVKASFDKLNAAEIDKVNAALTKTESLKRDMTTLELSTNGIRTDKEIEAYYAFRTMRNIEWYAKNTEAARSLTAQGYNHVFIGMGEAGSLSGPAKRGALGDNIGKRVFDVENNKFITITQDNIKELESRGVVLYNYKQAQELAGQKSAITAAITKPNMVKVGDVTSAIGRVDGAYSRVYTEEYFIKLNGKKWIDDALDDVTFAFRTAASEADAGKYVAQFNKLVAKRGTGNIITSNDVSATMGVFEKDAEALATKFNEGAFDNMNATFNYTRVEDNFFRDVTGIGREDTGKGRLFWSKRGEDAIQSISTGSMDAVTKGPLESLSAEMSNTAKFVAGNEFRRTAIQRWFNTFEDVISSSDKLGTKSAEDVFFNVVNNVKGIATTDDKTRKMLAVKDFIVAQLGVRTSDEMIIQHAVNNLTGHMKVPGFSHVGAWLRKTDLVNWAKGVNSTLMLGLFSPAQFFVQASGMLLAATISPKHGMKAAFSVRPILTALTSDNPKVWDWVHKTTEMSKQGVTSNEFARVAAAIKRTGLLDNVGASSVYNGADGATNIFARNKNKFNQAQMMFFNKGEEINRVGAFEIARREFIEANKGIAWDTDESLQKILLRADDLSMNMSRANEARYAQGAFGIPIQFLQHNIRLGTNIAASLSAVVGKKSPTLSTKEAFTLTLGSYLLYGINNNATPDFIEDWLGNKLNSTLDDTQKQFLTQGVLAGTLSAIGETLTGERTNIALGSRFSSIQWYEDLGDAMVDLLKGEGNKVDIYKMAGPTGSTLLAALEIPVIFKDYMSKDEWSLQEFGRTVSTVGASMSTTWRNIDKAYWAYHANGMVLNKRGDPTAQLTGPELFFQALGFQSTEAYESGTVFKTKADYASAMKNYADQVMRFNLAARKAYLAGDIDGMNANYRAASAILAPLPIADKTFIDRLMKENTSYDTVGREAFNKWANGLSSHKNRLLVTNPFGE